MNIKKAALTVLSITLNIVVTVMVLIGLSRLGSAAYHYGHSVFHAEAMDPAPGRQVNITVAQGDSAQEIAQLLQEKGLVEDWKLFFIQARLSKYYDTMEAGDYTLTTAMTPKEMMAVMSGESLEEEEED